MLGNILTSAVSWFLVLGSTADGQALFATGDSRHRLARSGRRSNSQSSLNKLSRRKGTSTTLREQGEPEPIKTVFELIGSRIVVWGGGIFAPAVTVWFRQLEKLPIKAKWPGAFARMALDQLVFAPIVLSGEYIGWAIGKLMGRFLHVHDIGRGQGL